MMLNWLEKATFTSSDLSGGSNGGLLSPDQLKQFLRIAIDESILIKEANNVTSMATKFEVPRISFAARILRAGTVVVQGARLVDGERVKPTTGLVTLSTVLLKGEVPISDEVFEDQVEQDSLADSIMTMIAEAVGRDVEEFVIKSDTARVGGEDEYLDQTEGLIKNLQSGLPAAQKLTATAYTSYDELFAKMIEALPHRYRRDYTALRFWIPVKHHDGYQRELAGRGTPLGDSNVTENMRTKLAFRGIPIVAVPLMSGTSLINTVSTDYAKFATLVHPMNTYVGWHRRIRVERWRDPRDGATSFLPTCRVDTKQADPDLGVLASNVLLGS